MDEDDMFTSKYPANSTENQPPPAQAQQQKHFAVDEVGVMRLK